jgi:hypothetical protein
MLFYQSLLCGALIYYYNQDEFQEDLIAGSLMIPADKQA